MKTIVVYSQKYSCYVTKQIRPNKFNYFCNGQLNMYHKILMIIYNNINRSCRRTKILRKIHSNISYLRNFFQILLQTGNIQDIRINNKKRNTSHSEYRLTSKGHYLLYLLTSINNILSFKALGAR